MEILNKQRVKVDFKKAVVNETLSFRQYDTNIVEFEILDNGAPANLSAITSIIANVQRPDKKVYSHVLTPVDNVVSFQLENIEMEVVGESQLVLHIYSNENRLSTTKIKLYIEGSIETGTIPTHEEVSIIEGLVQLVNNSLDGITQYSGRIDSVENDLSNRGVNVKQGGVKGDSVTNDSIRLQALLDEVRDNVIASNFTADNVLVIPAGRYRLNTQLIMSPFVKLKAAGRVVFETYIENGSALWITPRASDPAFLNIMGKQQWLRSPLLNGVDGGIVFINKLDRNTSNSTAVEFGSREDLGEQRPLSRYSVTDVAAQNYNVAFKMNRFRNYIASFDRLHLELNNTAVVYGEPDTTVVDSGENIHFTNSVFAAGGTGFRWYVDGFDTSFTNCSFDFINTVWHMSRGYKVVTMVGGHIEGINDKILLEDSVSAADINRPITIRVNGVPAVVKKDKLFVGSSKVHLALDGFEFRQLGSDTSLSKAFLVDDRIILKRKDITMQQRGIMPQSKLNEVLDWTFTKDTLGVKTPTTGLDSYSLSGENAMFEVVASDSELAGRALKITGTSSASWASIRIDKQFTAKAGDYLYANIAVKKAAGEVIYTFRYHYYDENDVFISTSEQRLDWLGPINDKVNEWFYPDFAMTKAAPKGTAHYEVECVVHGAGMVNDSVYLTGVYVTTI